MIIPTAPSHFSALGMILADLQKHFVRTHVEGFDPESIRRLGKVFAEMKREALATYDDDQSLAGKQVSFTLQLDLR